MIASLYQSGSSSAADGAVEARDLLSGETYMWRGEWNYVRLDPPARVAHVIALAFES